MRTLYTLIPLSEVSVGETVLLKQGGLRYTKKAERVLGTREAGGGSVITSPSTLVFIEDKEVSNS